MNMRQLKTKWADNINEKNVLGEYPRPLMRRKSYVNLNGVWKYAIKDTKGFPKKMNGDILVPFSPEAALSGVGRQLKPDEFLWYKRSLPEEIRPEAGNRWLLHFGAVDQCAVVYVNGKKQGKHVGGYLPFSFDVTDALQEERNILTIKVKDYSDTYYYSRGKQKLENGGMFYTAQSGIWQTVWMEKVPEYHIKDLKITPLYDQSSVMIQLEDVAGRKDIDYDVTVTARTIWPLKTAGRTGRPCMVRIPHMRNWSPEDPFLYDVHIKMGNDSVESYFAMRKIEVKNDKNGIPRIFLNNKPYFQKGVLDQGYWPDGLYTAPSDEALIYDIQTMKNLGFNMIRKHVKVETARWYYHCDRLGMIVWQDMVNGGTYYAPFMTWLPALFPKFKLHTSDRIHPLFGRKNVHGREEFIRECKDTVTALKAFPCISTWVIFNEGWGQFDSKKLTALFRELDDTRLIDSASGWFDRRQGDFKSEHNYFAKQFVTPSDRAFVISEYGGYTCQGKGHTCSGKTYGYKICSSQEEFQAAYHKLMSEEIDPLKEQGLCGAVYTQLSDIEDEINGLMTYDREVCKL